MGRDKNGIGTRGLKVLLCTTHGPELRLGGGRREEETLEGWGGRAEGR